MRLLLDTCAFLWITTDAKELGPNVRRVFSDPDNEVFLSSVSVWEIIVKYNLGKLPLPEPPNKFIRSQREKHDIETLPLSENEVSFLCQLPDYHKDPFDRMLICQAIAQDLTILTNDAFIQQYPVKTLWS